MGKARICDVCGQLVVGKRKIVKLLDVDDTSQESRDARVYQSIDMHEHCLKKVTDFIDEIRKGAK